MKSFLAIISLAATLTVSAANVSNIKGLAPYVFPENRVNSVSKPDYLPDGLSYLAISEDGKRIAKHDTKTGAEIETVMDVTNTRENKLERIPSYKLSPDGSKILICTEPTAIYRHSFKAKYYVYEIRTRILRPLSTTHVYQRSPSFRPTDEWWHLLARTTIFI